MEAILLHPTTHCNINRPHLIATAGSRPHHLWKPTKRGGRPGTFSTTPACIPVPTLFFRLKGQRFPLLLPSRRGSSRPSRVWRGVPRLLSDEVRLMGWLKSSKSMSPGLSKPDLCSSIRTCESYKKEEILLSYAEEPAHVQTPSSPCCSNPLAVTQMG